ncbi:Amidohydrolase 1 domain containing protein [Trichostrongylus colubriformis]|uniref:Amidohydrolase 1 domain containing protein n=1 Tax=Trichostrongylus colubriformis TaxID=6319 RepID=A0AAN8EWS0_TRICO
MIPFLAPIQVPQKRRNLRLHSECLVGVQFYSEIPDRYVESPTIFTPRFALAKKAPTVSSRPTSRNKSRSPHLASQPTSARSAKSSPIPPLQEAPPISRHRIKGLETSSAMMELFGGGSSFGTASVFDTITQPRESRNFHRKNVLQKEAQQLSDWETVKFPPVKGPFFSEIEDHGQAYERARKRGNWRSTTSHFDQIAQPGPENFECTSSGSSAEEHSIDPEILADAVDVTERETPKLGDDWKEAKEDVLGTPVLTEEEKQRMMESEPGPDLGDDEEAASVNNGDVEAVKGRTTDGDLQSEADGESSAATRDTEETSAEGASGGGGGGMSLIIRGAQVVNDDSVFFADVLIQDGVISNVGPSLEVPPDAEVVEAAGKMLLPAGIDVYTHLSVQDSADDLATGCKAAIAGGTATVIDVVSPRTGESLTSSFFRVKEGLSSSLCNIGLSVLVPQWSDAVGKEMEKLVSEGVNSFIISVEGDDVLLQASGL